MFLNHDAEPAWHFKLWLQMNLLSNVWWKHCFFDL